MFAPIVTASFLGQPVWLWIAFITVVIVLLVLDLGVLHRDDHEIGIRESLWLSLGYIAVGVLFGGFVWWQLGAEPATEYITGYLIEKSLSLDNVFVIASIFGALAVPRQFQHRVLFWGILGVLVLRALMVGLGALYFALAAMAHRFYYLKHALALVLVFIGAKIFLVGIVGKIPAVLSLGVTAALLVGGVVVSLFKTRKTKDTLGAS